MSENTRDVIRVIIAAPAHRQERLINDFMAARMGLFKQVARWLCRNFGQSVENHAEDFASMVSMEAYRMLTEHLEDPSSLEGIEIWEGMLRIRSREIVRRFLDTQMAPASGMSSIFRRVRVLNQTRDEMARELGRHPSDEEVVKTHNARMYADRSNPVKQGVLATVEDLQVFRQCADIQDHDYSEPIDTDFVLHPVEGPKFIKLLVDRTTEHNPKLGAAASLWLSGLYRTDGPPIIASVSEIAEQLEVSESTARAYVRRIKEYAIVVAKEQFNITEDSL